MKTCLITGGMGFLGIHLAKYLLGKGHQVLLFDNLSRGVCDSEAEELLAHERVEFVEGDLLQPDGLEKLSGRSFEYVFHFAAIIGVRHVLERPYAVLTDNVRMLSQMLDWASSQENLKRFFFTSTSEVTAGALRFHNGQIPTPETIPLTLNPLHENRTSYMLSKIYGEAMCMHRGLPFTIVRPHNIYGPRMGLSHVIPELLKKARSLGDGEELEVFSTDHRRAFCYVDDAIEMIGKFMALESCEGKVLNLGNGAEEVTMLDVGEKVLEVVGKTAKIQPKPATAGSPSRRCPDMSQVTDLTGFEASISLNEGIRRTYEWYTRHVFSQEGGVSAV